MAKLHLTSNTTLTKFTAAAHKDTNKSEDCCHAAKLMQLLVPSEPVQALKQPGKRVPA